MRIGERLKRLRLAKGMSLQEVADALHLNRGNISSVETGRNNPSLDTISRLCAVYGYKVAVVFVPPEDEASYEGEIFTPTADKRFK